MNDDGTPKKKGRGHPPKEHQWPKGVSGNRFGRPLGSKNKKKLGSGLSPTEQAFSEELERLVRSSDGEMSAIRAVMRSQLVTAAKGSVFAQRNLLDRATAIEQKKLDYERAALEKGEAYKRSYEEAKLTADPERLAKLEPLLLPHPDDVEVDWSAGSVKILGPANARERKIWNAGLDALAEGRALVLQLRRKVAADPMNEDLFYELVRFTDWFMRSNERLPSRYQLEPLSIWKTKTAGAFLLAA